MGLPTPPVLVRYVPVLVPFHRIAKAQYQDGALEWGYGGMALVSKVDPGDNGNPNMARRKQPHVGELLWEVRIINMNMNGWKVGTTSQTVV